jgi:hypothetical protein
VTWESKDLKESQARMETLDLRDQRDLMVTRWDFLAQQVLKDQLGLKALRAKSNLRETLGLQDLMV